jgi:hypothetical protein
LKEYAARDLLLRLEEAGHITLPPRLRVKNNHKRPSYERKPLFESQPLAGQVNEFSAPHLREARMSTCGTISSPITTIWAIRGWSVSTSSS